MEEDSTILFNPGPANVSERVRQVLLQPDICHRSPSFGIIDRYPQNC